VSKTRDWRKLVGKPYNVPAHVQQPSIPMRRTYPIGLIEAKFTRAAISGFHAYNYAEFMKLVACIEQVHVLNPAILISRGQSWLYATAHGTETPAETKTRLQARQQYLKAKMRELVRERAATGTREMAVVDELAAIEKAFSKQPKAKRKKREKK